MQALEATLWAATGDYLAAEQAYLMGKIPHETFVVYRDTYRMAVHSFRILNGQARRAYDLDNVEYFRRPARRVPARVRPL